MSSTLKQQLAQLHEELLRNPSLDEETAGLLRQLASDIEAVEPSSASSIGDGIGEVVTRFDADHPALAGILRQIVDSLEKMGV